MTYNLYRQSFIGKALQEVINQKVEDNEMTAMQARTILEKYDIAVPVVFQRSVQTNINFKGTAKSYNYVDGVWRFGATNFMMTVNNELIRSNFVKIVACEADTYVEPGRKRRGRKAAE